MAIQRALVDNPPPIPSPQRLSNQKLKEANPRQLQIPTSRKRRLFLFLSNLGQFIKRRELELELMPFWKGLSSPMAIISSLFVTLLALATITTRFNSLPPEIPVHYSPAIGTWQQVERSVGLIFPIVLGMSQLVALRLIYEIFKYDPRLSNTLGWVLVLVNSLALTGGSQLLSLVQGT